jgi:hypothetical protein
MITYSYFVSISAQILNYLFWSREWLLGVNDPISLVQVINKRLGLWQLLLQGAYKLPPKDLGEVLYPEQKHLAIFRGT